MTDWREGIEDVLRGAGVPGCAIGVTSRAGMARMVFGVAGMSPRRAVTPESWFHLFSGTKVYTAAAVMRLVERGAIRLDQPVAEVLPELRLRFPVTIRQLASHQSGLPETLRAFLAVHRGDEPGFDTAAALARYDTTRGRPPGRSVQYRNVNFAILGELVARVSGMPFERFVGAELLDPLGTTVAFRTPAGVDAAVGHIPRWSPMRIALRVLLPGTSAWIEGDATDGFVALRSFALDTAAIGGLIGPVDGFLPMLAQMLSDDDGVLSRASKREMLSVQAHGAAGIMSRDGVGLGWKRGLVGDVTFWNHEGGGPGFCTETRLYPADRLGIVILMNRSHSSALSRLCHDICERMRALSPDELAR